MYLTEAITRIRSSVVQISFSAFNLSTEESKKHGGRTWMVQPIGTGFFVNSDGMVITANHVIQSGLDNIKNFRAEIKNVSVGLAQANSENMRGNFNLVSFDIIEQDTIHDLALLQLKANPFRGQVKSGFMINDKESVLTVGVSDLYLNRPDEGSLMGISGYPLGENILISTGGS